MGEAVASSEEGMEVEETEEKGKKESSSTDGVRSERFLPRMVLRVLLVEADDSTRQIIATLLRKCSYIVSAVPDGLKAWETLKGRPHNIDLILTEVELPSISGYALLTLIMEHDFCKNIPVIMMSSQDSISVVLKFMLKGAADFLIKPVRRNELRNLWQHVWRRQVEKNCQRTIAHVPEYTAVEQQKVEVASENIVASIHSSDYLDSTPKNKECSEKGSDGQSSYTTPYLEAETAYMQNMQGLTQLKCRSTSNLSNTEKHVEFMKLVNTSVMPKSEIGGLLIQYEPESASCNEGYKSTAFSWDNDHVCAKTVTRGADSGPECQSGHASNNVEVNCHTDDPSEPSSEALDLIGKFEHCPKDTCGTLSANDGRNKFSFIPQLELSLSTFHPSCPKNEVTDERHILNHSNVSAFSWYSSRKASLFPTLTSNCTELKEDATTFHNELFNHLPESTIGTESYGDALNGQENMSTLSAGQSGHAEAELPGPQLGFIPVTGVKTDSFSAGYGQVFPPTQSSFPPVWSPKGQQKQSPFVLSSSLHSGSEIRNFEEGYCPYEETIRHSADQTVQEEDNNLESVEVLRHGSPTPGLSGIGSSCSGIESKLNRDASENICNGSDGNATPAAAAVRTSVSKRANDDSFFIHGLGGTGSHCCSQREAALIKFRLKRKDRCYEKKVRYQSRKRLAEQRPRVKGQFVRRVQTDTPLPES